MICLVVIARNEAGRIGRMVRSLGGQVQSALLVDTGSDDATKEEFFESCREIGAGCCAEVRRFSDPGEPFPFATARNWALDFARAQYPHASHYLFLDCDETLEGELPSPLPEGDLYACAMLSQNGATKGTDCLLIRAGLVGTFTPPTHEAFRPTDEYREVWLPGVRIVSHDDSARRASGVKSAHDVALLEPWCREHPDDHRAQYYLAQSLWNVSQEQGHPRAALEAAASAFAERVVMPGGHPEETWFSMYMRAACLEKLGQPRPVILEAYLTAYNADPVRSEPLCALWSYLFEQRETCGDWALMEMLALTICQKTEPDRGMYVDRSCYKWRGQYMLGLSFLGSSRWEKARGNLRAIFPLLPEDEKIIARQAIRICEERST